MPIVGHNETLPLLDLVQNKASERGSHRFTIEGSQGAGILVLESGMVVHAEYGGKSGDQAAVDLLTERGTYYLVRSGSEVKQRTMQIALGRLLLSAEIPTARPVVAGETIDVESGYSGPHSVTSMRRAEIAQEVTETRNNVAAFPTSAPATETRTTAPPNSATPAEPRSPRRAAILVAAGAIFVLGAAAFFALQGGASPTAGSTEPIESVRPAINTEGALEVSDLSPQDRAPTLLDGEPAPLPTGTTTVLSPTITCRILVGADGRVREAEIYRSRPDLAAFETAALEAVRGYRFEPARVGGAPQEMWINFPVRFQGS